MTRIARFTLAAALLLAGTSLSGQGKTDPAPAADFGISDPVNGIIKDWSGKASIRTGAETQIISGPAGARALKFSGSENAVCRLLPEGMLKPGRDFAISFSIRLDSEPGKNVDTGLGMILDSWNYSFGKGAFALKSAFPLTKGKWSEIVFLYSADCGEAELYQDGRLAAFSSGRKLPLLDFKSSSFGKFNGAVASLRIWDYAASECAVLEIPVNGPAFSALGAQLEAEAAGGKCPPALQELLKNAQKKAASMRNRKSASPQAVEEARNCGVNALKLAEGAKYFRGTSLADAPFALLQIQPLSPHMHRPDIFPGEAEFTANLRVAAAKGECEPLSFIIFPYRDLDTFTVTLSDFRSEKGNVIPASAVDRKIVKHLYRSNWNGSAGVYPQIPVPDLLVNDDSLAVANRIERKNYLRTGGPGNYSCLSAPAGDGGNTVFKLDGVRDSKELLPVRLAQGKGRQFWFTICVPENAPGGLYTAKAEALSGGKKIAGFTVTLRVYPFLLPPPKTRYDLSKDYLPVLAGAADLARCAAQAGEAAAEKLHRAELENLKKHGILHPVIPAPGKDLALFEKDLALRKSLGFPMKGALVAAFPDDGTLMEKLAPESPVRPAGFPAFSARAESAGKAFSRIAGHQDFFFCGVDEGAGKIQAEKFREHILKKGGKLMTSGWSDSALLLPANDLLHAMPGEPDDRTAEKWHAVRARLLAGGIRTSGVYDPDLIRRTFGMKIYRADYDGFFLTAAPDPHNPWSNPAAGSNHPLTYPALSGPVNTIAMEALREGIDDVRYLTLLRTLMEEAFTRNNMDAIYAAKKAVSLFELSDTERIDLDLLRMELADHITVIMKHLGKEVNGK